MFYEPGLFQSYGFYLIACIRDREALSAAPACVTEAARIQNTENRPRAEVYYYYYITRQYVFQ